LDHVIVSPRRRPRLTGLVLFPDPCVTGSADLYIAPCLPCSSYGAADAPYEITSSSFWRYPRLYQPVSYHTSPTHLTVFSSPKYVSGPFVRCRKFRCRVVTVVGAGGAGAESRVKAVISVRGSMRMVAGQPPYVWITSG